jgi:glucokinase
VERYRSILAIDIGGTKIEAGLVDAEGAVAGRRRVATPAGDAKELFEAVCSVADGVLAEAGLAGVGLAEVGSAEGGDEIAPAAIGVGCGGPMTAGGATVSPLNIPGWRDFPLLGRLAARYELPVSVDNDAKALALGEGWVGAAAGCADFIAMVVSTGVGGGIVSDGRLIDGASGNAGHIGHVIVEPDGRPCRCGARGCLEAEASGLSIAAITGRPAAEAGPEVRERVGRLVGRAVGSVANLLDLRLAVVAGSVALGYGDDFFSAAQDELDRTARLEYSAGARIVPAGTGDAGPLIGAGALGWRELGGIPTRR